MSELNTFTSTEIPLAPLPGPVTGRARRASAKQVNLYHVLVHAPRRLKAWIDFTRTLRDQQFSDKPFHKVASVASVFWEHHDPVSAR